MGGNVWQWCEDWFDASHRQRLLRGGSWYYSHRNDLLLSARHIAEPTYHSIDYGFRCVLDVTPVFETAGAGEDALTQLPSLHGADFGGWNLTGGAHQEVKDGDLVLISSGPRSGLVSNRDNFKNFTLRVELAGTSDVVAWVGLRVNQGHDDWKGYTNAIRGHDGVVSVRHASADFIPSDGDDNPAAPGAGAEGADVPAGTLFNLELTVRSDGSALDEGEWPHRHLRIHACRSDRTNRPLCQPGRTQGTQDRNRKPS